MDVLVALVAAAESKTKAEAAGKLRLSISALDKRFKSASSLFGAPLVQQSDSEIRLTEEGEIFYTSAVRSVEFASLAEQNTRTHLLLKMNHVLVGHSSYLAPGVLALVHGLKFEEHPRVRVNHRAGLTGSIARSVRDGEMLAGFGFLPLKAPELVIRKVWEEPLMVCIPASDSMASRSFIRAEDLDGKPFIAVSRDPMPGMTLRRVHVYLGHMLRCRRDRLRGGSLLRLRQCPLRCGITRSYLTHRWLRLTRDKVRGEARLEGKFAFRILHRVTRRI